LFWFAFLKPVIRTFSVQEAPWIMRLPVLLIAAGSITFLFQNGHPASFATQMLHTAFEVPPSIIIISAVVTGISLLTAWLSRNLSARTSDYIIQRFLDYVDLQIARLVAFIAELTTLFDKKWIDRSIHAVAYSKITLAHISGWADRNMVDGSVQGVLWITRGLGNATRSVVNGKIQSYLLWAMAGLLIFILWMFY
ncbi:MAG TPA: hypothetical protein PKK67_12410, partial [Cyclobacteriaceae bacterium]|nr:hypothetical protein [Cyclobacteriaceae bacterium]